MIILGLSPKTNSCLYSMRHLLLGVIVRTPIARPLLKVLDSLTWWWHSFSILSLIITLSQSLVLNDELCQVNTRVGRIAWRQIVMGGFTASSSPSPQGSKDASDDGSGSDDADEDDGASSFSDDEMIAWVTCPLSFVTKMESSFGMRVVIYLGGELA